MSEDSMKLPPPHMPGLMHGGGPPGSMGQGQGQTLLQPSPSGSTASKTSGASMVRNLISKSSTLMFQKFFSRLSSVYD